MRQDKKDEKDLNPFDMADSDEDEDGTFALEGDGGCAELTSYMKQMEAFSNTKQSLLK